MDEVTSTLDANISDQMKLENMQEYFSNIEFNDKVDKDKYNFNIMGHHESYMFFGSYTKNKLYEKNWSDAYNSSVDYERDKNEAQFQISIKVPLYKRFLGTKSDLFVAYTQNSYWQVYNTEHSAPFRETNYMPELFLEWQPNKKFGESKLIKSRISLIHQSNGQDVGKSRSWNRTELYFLFKRDNFYYGFNMWDRWNEDAKPDASSTKGDDNIGLEKYIGKQKYFVKYKTDNINLTLSHQNQLFNYNINRGNTKLDIAFPSINSNFDFFVRYFDGYGESLIDYDIKVQRISFGILIADWI
jgi:phospholipase A1